MTASEIRANHPGRHPATIHVLKFFAFAHLPERLQLSSQQFYNLAANMVNDCPDNIELTVALRKLLEAKDAFIRAMVEANEGH